MAHIIDYVKKYQFSISDTYPINRLDVAVLNELGYLLLGEWLPILYQEQLTLLRDYKEELQSFIQKQAEDFLVTKERLDLLEEVLQSSRFDDLAIGYYVNDRDENLEKQFSALYLEANQGTHRQLVFRGTDDSLIGWKEDFKLTYMREVSAHRAAISYLKKLLAISNQIIVSGHSKGGNLAVYAASQLSKEMQDRILAIYAFDSPGVHSSILSSPGYQYILEKLVLLRPQEAIIGMMLYQAKEAETIASDSFGIYQHNINQWLVDETDFLSTDTLAETSRQLEKALHEWTEQLTNQELKLVFDSLFDTLIDTGVSSLNDLSQLGEALGRLSTLPAEKRVVLNKSFALLFKLLGQHLLKQEFGLPEFPLSQHLKKYLKDKK